jgi:uncharacterized membrane protein YfcA
MNEITAAWQSQTPYLWALAFFAVFLAGISKAGLKGIDILIVTILVLVFGAKPSSGILLPLLCLGDVIAVIYYRRHVNWQHLFTLLPWIAAGVLLGVWVGNEIDEATFKKIMAVIIVLAIITMTFNEMRKSRVIPKNKSLAVILGLSAGFTTMLGNLAGPFANLYFLLMRFDKNAFIGTAAWLFLFINLFKLPFHLFVWQTITEPTGFISLLLVPVLLIGFVVGIKIVAYIKTDSYRKMIIVLTLLGACIILFS